MAEEALYEVEQGGDPDPLGLRKKLKQVKTDKPDPLGLRPKLAQQAPVEQPKPEPQQPAFKPMSDWLNIPQQGYQPMDQANAIPIDDHTRNTAQAADRVKKEIETIDPHIHNLIYEKKNELTGRIKSEELGINPRESAPINPQAAELESKMKADVEVLPKEVEDFKTGMSENPGMVRDAVTQKIKDLSKTDAPKANQLKADIYRVDAQDRPDKEKKITQNEEKLRNGELEYDARRGVLYKPEGFFQSIVTGFKQKNQLFKDYEVFKNSNEADVIKALNAKMKEQDPDTPMVVPDGAAGEAGAMLGGMPIKPIVGGLAAGALTTPAGGATAAAGISAHEMYKLGYAGALQSNYAALKRRFPDKSDEEIYKNAAILADGQAKVDATTGAAMGLIGAKIAIKPAASLLLQQSVKSALRQIGETVAIEGLGGGAIGAGGQYIKNIMSQKAGIHVDEAEGMTQQLIGGVMMTLGMSLAAKAGNLLKPSTRTGLFHALTKMPELEFNEQLSKAQEVGAITPDEAHGLQTAIAEQKKIDASVPENVPESERVKIHSKIKERDALQTQLETSDKAFHPEIKEKIKALEEDIVNISKGNDRGELQQLVAKADKNGELVGDAQELLQHDEKTLRAFFKDISGQANDPATEKLAIDTFGKGIVNKAKELFPKKGSQAEVDLIEKNRADDIAPIDKKIEALDKESNSYYRNRPKLEKEKAEINAYYDEQLKTSKEVAEKQNAKIQSDKESVKSISVIQPGEIKHPETITIKPQDNAIQEPSTSSLLQHPQEGIGAEGSERGGMESGQQGEIPAGQEIGGQPKEEGTPSGQEKVAELKVDEAYVLPFIDDPQDKRTGIKNFISKSTRFERKLPDIEVGKLGADQQILQEGKDLVDQGKISPVDVVNRILDTKEGMQPDEAKAMQYYMHQLNQHETNLRTKLADTSDPIEHADVLGQLQQNSDEVDAATEANIISGKAWSDVGNIRQIVSDTGFNASRERAVIKDAYGGTIPKEAQMRLDKALKERDDALNRLAKLQREQTQKDVADIIKEKSAPRNPKKTSTEFKDERTQIKKDISDKLKKGRTGESGLTAVPLPFAKELISITPEIFKLIKSYAEEGVQKTEEVINRLHETLKDELDGITKADIVNLLAGKYKAQGDDVSPIAQRIRDFRSEAALWTRIAQATKMEEDTPAKQQQKNKKLEDLRDRLNDIRKRNKEADAEAKDLLTTDAQREIKKLQQRRKAAESQLKNKKYLLPNEKKNVPVNTEIVKEKQRIVNANYKIKVEKRKAFESQKNMYQKGLMWIGRAVRLSVLSGYNVLGKLAAAATIGGAAKRIPEQAIGYIYGHAFRGIAEKAPIEGMVNAQAEAKFYKEFFNPKTFAKNAWEILKSGESPLSKKFATGQYEHIPGLYLPTDLHQIIKDPVKRATYEASLKNALAWAERSGLDINDDLVIQSLETAAYKRAQYEIFQESNVISRKFGEWKGKMEKAGNWGATGKFLADFMIPVSTVPTNIARRVVTTSPLGLIRGASKVIEAYRKGIETLTPEQADSVMKQLKQGTLGTALWLIGWYGAAQFGGLYSKFNPNKSRDQGDLKSDEMSVGGKMVPKPVQHALPLEIIQFAATARRVYDNYRDNKDANIFEATEKAGLASIGGLVEQIPVIETGAHAVGAFTNPYEAKQLENDVKRRFQPQILRETGIIGKKESEPTANTSSGKLEKPGKLYKPSK